jgi:hypothetical protein
MALDFDEKEELAALGNSLKVVLDAGGAFMGLTKVIIQGTSFPDLTPEQAKAAPNAAADLGDLQGCLETAQGHAITWINSLAPEITILPQAFINISSFVDQWAPRIGNLDKKGILDVLKSTSAKIGAEAIKLNSLSTMCAGLQGKLAVDAGNFSETHASFADLEKLDSANLTATKAALAKIKALIAQESATIKVDLSDANQNLETATEVLKAGKEAEGEGSEWVKMAAVVIGLVFIIIAQGQIGDALANIDQRLKNAQKEAQYQVNFTQLTLQLLALQNANTTLASLNSDVTAVQQILSAGETWLLARQKDLDAIVAAGAPAPDVSSASLKAYADAWRNLSTAGNNWQRIEAGKPVSNEVSLAGFARVNGAGRSVARAV